MRSARVRVGWGALLIAATNCLGGQTGQPTSIDCGVEAVAPDESVQGVTPNEFVAAFEGTHEVPLAWETSEGAATRDTLALELRRAAPLQPLLECSGDLRVTVHFTLSTRNHGVLGTQPVHLEGQPGQVERAELYVIGSRVTLAAELVVVDGNVHLSGRLETADTSLPATRATFPAPGGAGGAGGGG
jgi:hypothetical protein